MWEKDQESTRPQGLIREALIGKIAHPSPECKCQVSNRESQGREQRTHTHTHTHTVSPEMELLQLNTGRHVAIFV